MQKTMKFALALTGVLICPALHAEEGGFENFLLRSPQHFSPSQNYQVKQQGRFEAFLGFDSGKVEGKNGASDQDVTGTDLGVAGYWSPDALFVVGLDVDYSNIKYEDAIDGKVTTIVPSIAFNVTPMFALGLQVNVATGSVDLDGAAKDAANLLGRDTSDDVSYTNVTLGATAHQNDWEATLAYTTESKDDKKVYNNSPATFALHGRYRFIAPFALGLSYQSKDWSNIASTDKDETVLGIHVDSQFTPDFAAEFAFLSTTNGGGADSRDSSEFVALLQYKIQPQYDIGLRLAYTTTSEDNAGDESVFSPGVFFNARF